MPGTTTRLSLPYPVAADTVDVPRDVRALADALAPITTSFLQGTLAARPAGGTTGRLYYATDTDELFYDDGTAFNPITPGESSAGSGGQLPVLDVGMTGQVRAGRELTVADFTDMGLTQPVGLFNLSNLTNLGSGGALVNKGAVPFGAGINGLASTSAVFAGATTQALYIADTGAADPFRIKTGSWGCWFRTAKRGTQQWMIVKDSTIASNRGWGMSTATSDGVTVYFSNAAGSGVTSVTTVSDVCDDRWHFVVVTVDGTQGRAYVDGVLEASVAHADPLFASTAPLNIGGRGADSGVAANLPSYGRVDEAFVTADVLTEDQIRNLYCARLPHSLPSAPSRASINVHRRRRGAALATTDFPTQPLRLHNFTAGALTDQGSGGVAVTAQGTAPISVAGADGTPGGGYSFGGAGSLAATDAGLPAALTARSYGCWFKTATIAQGMFLSWGAAGVRIAIFVQTSGVITSTTPGDLLAGPFVADGQWHFVVSTDDNTAGDGVKRKLYLDGRMVNGSTVLNSVTLGGANRFRIGADADGTSPFTGQIDGAFVCGYALTHPDIAALYAKGTQDLGPSPKNEGDHIEALRTSDVLATFDTLGTQDLVDVGVVS